jgi:oxygen-independent coproporphyrinogen-3 oxidase
MKLTKEIINQFNVPGPRYTSYPTAPEWKDIISQDDYKNILKTFGTKDKTLSVYVHIPFCQSLCFYCGCNIKINTNRAVAEPYLKTLYAEIEMTAQALGSLKTKKKITQFHIGGGTPTFLTPVQLKEMFEFFQKYFEFDLQNGEIAIEVDPRTTTDEHLVMLRSLGFNRISMGLQDFDPKVQEAVHRIQSFELVEKLIKRSRELGFISVNVDLIYGLPHQTIDRFSKTIEQVMTLKPDRIALYSYAHLPQLIAHHKLIHEKDLPGADEKLGIFLMATEKLTKDLYLAIAMDHFALKTDDMAKAFENGKLHRNFMGYTLKPADEYLGFGVSAIGYIENTYIQNIKNIENYTAAVAEGKFPITRGKRLTQDDLIRQWVINALMCRFKLDQDEFKRLFGENFGIYFSAQAPEIAALETQGLIKTDKHQILVTDLGKLFVRNVCMVFDAYLKTGHREFSKTI